MCIQEMHYWYYPIWKSLKSHINVTKAKIFYRYMEKNVALDSTLVEPSWEIHNQVQSFPILCNCFSNKSEVLVVFIHDDDFEPLREVLSVLFSNLLNPVWVLYKNRNRTTHLICLSSSQVEPAYWIWSRY